MTPELSIVIPCLNEAETVGRCVEKAVGWLARNPTVLGEVIVADNGSTDDSQAVAERAGARVVSVTVLGYGSALMGGIGAARGEFIVMGDADDSYDFGDLMPFVEKLRAGFDLVQGCRLPAGGGKLMKDAMPFLHRWWGNPMFTWIARRWFHAPLNDIYCGLRGFRKAFQLRLDQRCTGMEFATEMVIKACLQGAKIAEVPITLYPDGRTVRGSHLRTFRDGWRTLRFLLLYSPDWLFFAPGAALVLLGLIGYGLALPGVAFGSVHFDAHTLLFASLALICGVQAIAFFLLAKVFAVTEGLLPEPEHELHLLKWFNLERGLALGVISLVGGVALLAWAVNLWRETGFGPLDYSRTMRFVIPGATLTAIGFQAVLASFFLSVLGLKRK
jgi:glycosyltransferase involved in cell wall biosynthesis